MDNGNTNFGMTDLLPNKANQFTTKVDHHFNNAVALSGFFLRQETHEANSNYNPVNDFVGSSYQLDRVIKTFVVNNTYILNPSTVLTVRGGYNKFDDNYNLNDRNGNPLSFNVSTLGWPSSLTSQMSDTQRFPSMTITGYKGSGWTNRQANGYYQYGANGTLSKLTGSHNVKMGGDYRIIGAQSLNYGASTGSFTFSGGFSGNALADLLLGYPQASSTGVPLNAQLDGYVRYYSGYAQDDWRVNDRLTLNYGIRLEHETGMMEKNNQQTINFDQTAINPLNSQVKLIDPVTGAQRQILGGLVFAGVNGAADRAGQSTGDQAGAARRHGLQLQRKDRASRRVGPLLLAVELPRGGDDRLGSDRLLGDDARAAVDEQRADGLDEQPVPQRTRAAERQRQWAADGRRRRRLLRRSEQGRAAGPAGTRSTCSASWAAASPSPSGTPA